MTEKNTFYGEEMNFKDNAVFEISDWDRPSWKISGLTSFKEIEAEVDKYFDENPKFKFLRLVIVDTVNNISTGRFIELI